MGELLLILIVPPIVGAVTYAVIRFFVTSDGLRPVWNLVDQI